MANRNSSNKTYVSPDNKATIICPKCKMNKTISVESFKNKQHEIRVRCKCGYPFTVHLEFRRYFRKETSLQGNYNLISPSQVETGRTTVTDLSLKGASFEVRNPHEITPGMKGELVFTLDNRKLSILYRKVIIRSVKGSKIGCEFEETNAPSSELGFYLLPKNK